MNIGMISVKKKEKNSREKAGEGYRFEAAREMNCLVHAVSVADQWAGAGKSRICRESARSDLPVGSEGPTIPRQSADVLVS